jgi:oligopeptide transport system ATP-binding protein
MIETSSQEPGSESINESPLVEIDNIVMHFDTSAGAVRAVDGVSLTLARGETLGLVGESGCGKSTLGRTVLRLYDPTSGDIRFDGNEITRLKGEALRTLRSDMQMVFQDPLASLNPRMRVGAIISEVLREHGLASRQAAPERTRELFELVGLSNHLIQRYPRELSGGERQRVAIARALAVNPRFIVADEAVASLDVSVGAQVINLLDELSQRLGIAYLFISHDLAMVQHISDRVAVMYLGRIVELADAEDIFSQPLHPYTVALLSAIPGGGPTAKRLILGGDPPSPIDPPSGCRFHTRCPVGPTMNPSRTICAEVEPTLSVDSSAETHSVACHFPSEMAVPVSVSSR